jgi:asparagine synthetase B (glutamine-hydrolysing)
MSEMLNPEYRVEKDVSRAFVAEHFGKPGASTPLDRALRLDTEVMLVDDPVKRVDNMTMAWGLEGRVPFLDHELVELAAACPPELKLAQGGKGVLKEASRRVIPPRSSIGRRATSGPRPQTPRRLLPGPREERAPRPGRPRTRHLSQGVRR